MAGNPKAAVLDRAIRVFGWGKGDYYLFDMSLMSLLCVIGRMPQVLWREREIPDEIMAIVREDRRV